MAETHRCGSTRCPERRRSSKALPKRLREVVLDSARIAWWVTPPSLPIMRYGSGQAADGGPGTSMKSEATKSDPAHSPPVTIVPED